MTNSGQGPAAGRMPAADILTVRNLTISVGRRELVHDVSFAIASDERLGIIGASGSGKTLTCMAVAGLLPEGVTAHGSVRLAGVDTDLVNGSERRLAAVRGLRIGTVFQEPMTALNPTMTIGRQVAEVMIRHRTKSRKAARAAVLELLESTGLPDPRQLARSYPHQLSGGQRQRVVLAIAIANSPDLLICDEPTTALDVTVQARVLTLIAERSTAVGAALLFVSHDLAVVASLCDRVLVMFEGRVVEQGSLVDVLTHPEHQHTKQLLADSDLSILGELPVRTDNSSGNPAEPAVEAAHVWRKFVTGRSSPFAEPATVLALADINLSIPRRARFGIVGESGSGKTTLMRLIAGLDKPTSGTITVSGTDITGLRERELGFLRKSLQIVFQDPMGSLDPRMRVRDIIAEPLEVQGIGGIDAAVATALDQVGLPADAARRYPHQFSGGQRQRISIARAIAPDPSILLADEAVSALDVTVQGPDPGAAGRDRRSARADPDLRVARLGRRAPGLRSGGRTQGRSPGGNRCDGKRLSTSNAGLHARTAGGGADFDQGSGRSPGQAIDAAQR